MYLRVCARVGAVVATAGRSGSGVAASSDTAWAALDRGLRSTVRAMHRARIAAVAIAVLVGAAAPAAASCPDETDRTLCRPISSLLVPTAIGLSYFPGGDLGVWYGGGVELVGLTWGDSSAAFGPSHGKLRFDIGLLRSNKDGFGTMVQYRGGFQVSFEKNPSRRWLIPYFAGDLGGMWFRAKGSEPFVGAGVGAYVYYSARLIVDVGGGWLLPFDDA